MFELLLNKLFFVGALPIIIFLGLIFGPVLGLVAVVTDWFARFYTLILGALLFLVLKTPLLARLFPSQKVRAHLVAAVGVLLGVFGLWGSLIISRHLLPNPSANAYAVAGFPLQAFTYPIPPMGSDFVPREMWSPFFFNLFIWMVIGLVLAILLPRFVARFERRLWVVPVLIGLISLYGLAYLLFQFD